MTAGYDLGAVIGRGGMGEVVEARDRRIGRDVAFMYGFGAHRIAARSQRALSIQNWQLEQLVST